MKQNLLRRLRCDASGASQPARIVKELGRNSSAPVVRFIGFGVVSFVACVRRPASSLARLMCKSPLTAPSQRRCLACCFRARTAALFSLLFPRPHSGAVQPAV